MLRLNRDLEEFQTELSILRTGKEEDLFDIYWKYASEIPEEEREEKRAIYVMALKKLREIGRPGKQKINYPDTPEVVVTPALLQDCMYLEVKAFLEECFRSVTQLHNAFDRRYSVQKNQSQENQEQENQRKAWVNTKIKYQHGRASDRKTRIERITFSESPQVLFKKKKTPQPKNPKIEKSISPDFNSHRFAVV